MAKFIEVLENKYMQRIDSMYTDGIKQIASGNETDDTELELEILFNIMHEIDVLIKEEGPVESEIIDAWLTIIAHHVLLRMHDNNSYDERFNRLANELFLRIFK